MASSLSYFQVKVNTKECLFDKSSWPYNCHISFSPLKNRALDSEYICNNTRTVDLGQKREICEKQEKTLKGKVVTFPVQSLVLYQYPPDLLTFLELY